MDIVIDKQEARRSVRQQRGLVAMIAFGSLLGTIAVGWWVSQAVVARYWKRPEARFEMAARPLQIPPERREERLNLKQYESMLPAPTMNDRLVSTRPRPFAMPDLPEAAIEQMLPIDSSVLAQDQLASLQGSRFAGSGEGFGLEGLAKKGRQMNFLGVETEGERIVLLFDVSRSVVNKAEASGVPLDKIRGETRALIDGLPIRARFAMIQFTQNYKPFGPGMLAATDGNKRAAREWLDKEWVGTGSLSGSGVVSNPAGLAGVLDVAFTTDPDLIFIISDASFQWRVGGGIQDIPYDVLEDRLNELQKGLSKPARIHLIGFEMDAEDEKAWKRLLRREGGGVTAIGKP